MPKIIGNIAYPDDWFTKSKEEKIKEVLDSHNYIMKHFSKHRWAKVAQKTKELLKEIQDGSTQTRP